jgi:AbrB family looped-hinge helix DNA binding protein
VILVKITSNGQLTIPHEIREKAQLRPGDTVQVDIHDAGVVHLRRLQTTTFAEMFEEDLVDLRVDWDSLVGEAEQAEADAVLAVGRFKTFDDVEAFLENLEQEAGSPPE